MTHVPSAIAERMDKFFLLSQEKDNLQRRLKKVENGDRDNIKNTYRRLIAKLDVRLALVRDEIERLEFVLACSSCTLSE
jgi:hypothetical protein